jgi:methylated-DNA-protein-cysteine methyltransferase-like protein
MRESYSPFYERVYAIVRLIPKGKVTSYGRIADMLDATGAARQVGYAMSALKNRDDNPRYTNIPWQRVVNSQGRISIKGSDQGRLYQAELLREEGVEVDHELKIDLNKYLWEGLLPHEVREVIKDIK